MQLPARAASLMPFSTTDAGPALHRHIRHFRPMPIAWLLAQPASGAAPLPKSLAAWPQIPPQP